MGITLHFGDAHVAQFDLLALRQENVEALDVAVDHVALVDVVHSQKDLVGEVPEVALAEILFALALVLQHLVKVALTRILHQDVEVFALQE